MRFAAWESSLSRSRAAARSNSIRQAVPLHQRVQGNRRIVTGAALNQPELGEVQILEIVEMFKDCLTDVIALAASGSPRERIKTSLDFGGKPDGQHDKSP